MVIRSIKRTDKFERNIKSIKDKTIKEKVKKQIRKIIENPKIGKHLRYDLHGEYSVYVKPFRLIYTVKDDSLILLRFRHRKTVYR
jgi:mRNA-degrading endonuclease RelE of RelBE toxin-antitoxin system